MDEFLLVHLILDNRLLLLHLEQLVNLWDIFLFHSSNVSLKCNLTLVNHLVRFHILIHIFVFGQLCHSNFNQFLWV